MGKSKKRNAGMHVDGRLIYIWDSNRDVPAGSTAHPGSRKSLADRTEARRRKNKSARKQRRRG